jgi:hypothetical protein
MFNEGITPRRHGALDMQLRAAFLLPLAKMLQYALNCLDLSRRKTSVCSGQELNQFPSDPLRLMGYCMKQQAFSEFNVRHPDVELFH